MSSKKKKGFGVDGHGHRLPAFSLRMENELRARAEESARENGRTLTAELNYLIDIGLDAIQSKATNTQIMKKLDSIEELLLDTNKQENK